MTRRVYAIQTIVLIVLLLGHFIVWAAYPRAWAHYYQELAFLKVMAPPVLMSIGWFALLGVLRKKGCRETFIVPVAALLAGFGILFLLRLAGGSYMQYVTEISPHWREVFADKAADIFAAYGKQVIFFFVGLAALLAMLLVRWDVQALTRYKYLVGSGAVLLLLVTTLFGKETGGQQIALNMGFFTFQPHEPVKLLIVIFMAAYLVEKRDLLVLAAARARFLSVMDLRYLGPMVALWLLVMAIVFKHKDLGAALLLFGIFLGMLYLGTGRKTYVALGLGMFLLGIFAAYSLVSRVQTRVAIWLDPWQERYINDQGYQIAQSLMALGNGKLIGAGLAGGYPEIIPAIHTDMIYAAISEDFGLVGAVMIFACFLLLIERIFAVGLRARDAFGGLLIAGLGVSLALQTLVIIGGVVKAIPLTGVTLPFISYGGTSVVINFVILGLVLKVAAQSHEAAPAT
ncbi:MAG: Lipid II flippase FtsW [bacterium ADurb.Bin429]|nr:MAG: Lipid II flippase FtsW [bacterium ADurb.Bin429]